METLRETLLYNTLNLAILCCFFSHIGSSSFKLSEQKIMDLALCYTPMYGVLHDFYPAVWILLMEFSIFTQYISCVVICLSGDMADFGCKYLDHQQIATMEVYMSLCCHLGVFWIFTDQKSKIYSCRFTKETGKKIFSVL